MPEVYVLSAVLTLLAGVLGYQAWLSRKNWLEVMDRDQAREKEYLKLIRSLENRLTAKDITTYWQMEAKDRDPPESPQDRKSRLELEVKAHELEQARYFGGQGVY
jgi:hypothetical protein